MVRAPALIAILGLIASAPAYGQRSFSDLSTGNGILRVCEEQDGSNYAWYCLGFIEGLIRADDLQRSMGSTTAYLCDMPNVTLGQKIEVVVKHLKAHPETRHYEGASLALYAIKAAFCPRD